MLDACRHRGGRQSNLSFTYRKQSEAADHPTLDHAARRAACAGDEGEGKDRMSGSCRSKAAGFTVLSPPPHVADKAEGGERQPIGGSMNISRWQTVDRFFRNNDLAKQEAELGAWTTTVRRSLHPSPVQTCCRWSSRRKSLSRICDRTDDAAIRQSLLKSFYPSVRHLRSHQT